MKKFSLSLCLVLIVSWVLTSCMDSPRNKRNAEDKKTSNAFTTPPAYPRTYVDDSDDDSSDSTSGDSSSTTNTGNVPTEISHCSWSADGSSGFQSTSSDLGAYTLCQSSTNELDVYLQVQSPVTDAQLCIIPTYFNGTQSIYIGEPRCLRPINRANRYKITLLKNRPGYYNFNINSVMMMKDKRDYYYTNQGTWDSRIWATLNNRSWGSLQPMFSIDAYLHCSNILDIANVSVYCVAFKNKGNYTFHAF